MDKPMTSKQQQCILVVDDSEDMLALLERLLGRADYRVVVAEDGQTALTQAKRQNPDLILMDLSLPGIDGWEATGHLRKMPEFRATPIIAVSAHVSPSEEARALAAGCTAHMGKPFDTQVLLQRIASLLSDL